MDDRTAPVLLEAGNYDKALLNGRRLLDEDASAALKQAEALVRQRADPRAFRLAASALRRLNMPTEAQSAELAAIKAGTMQIQLQEAALADADGRSEEARQIAEQYLDENPDDLLACTLVAETSLKLWDLERAEQLLQRVLARASTFLRASLTLAECHAAQARMRDAIAVSEEVLRRKPDNRLVLATAARYLTEVGDISEATSIYEKLAKIDGRQSARWVELAHSYRMEGRRDEAMGAFRQAIKLNSANGPAWWGLANYFGEALDEQDSAGIENALEKQETNPSGGALQLALGLIADRNGHHARAFEQFAKGKRIELLNHPYDPLQLSLGIDGILKILTSEYYARRSPKGWLECAPIFVVGLPRSGTTLIERILGRHRSIEATGELQILPRLAEWARHKVGVARHSPALLESISDSQFSWVGERYMEASRDYRHTGKPIFIDKNNLNWMQIGLILLALPKARVIDMRRNALDCCWANFKMLFSQHFPASNDLRHVGQFYRDYVRLFDAMKIAAPGRILSVRYEDVVDDLEGQTRRMLDFLGLEFEPQCLDFHLATGAVATASSEQVRQPLNRKGIGSAEPYRQWLGPLIEELGELASPPAA